jgi:hypothetical protein
MKRGEREEKERRKRNNGLGQKEVERKEGKTNSTNLSKTREKRNEFVGQYV